MVDILPRVITFPELRGCGWPGDCHDYEVAISVTEESTAEDPLRNEIKTIHQVEACVVFKKEFLLSDYLYLRGWNLFSELLTEQDKDSNPALTMIFSSNASQKRKIAKIEKWVRGQQLRRLSCKTFFRWNTVIQKSDILNELYASDLKDRFHIKRDLKLNKEIFEYIKNNKEVMAEFRTGIQNFYKKIDNAIKTIWEWITEDGCHEGWKLSAYLGLIKTPNKGYYEKGRNIDLLNFLFGKQYEFCNQDFVSDENGIAKIPNYWIKTSDLAYLRDDSARKGEMNNIPSQDFSREKNANTYIGRGCRTQLIEWGVSPYPFVIVRTSKIERTADQVIREKITGDKQKFFAVFDVYIIALIDKKAKSVKLSKNYFNDSADRMEILCPLAIGELEASLHKDPETEKLPEVKTNI
jgi:hypothetical protein